MKSTILYIKEKLRDNILTISVVLLISLAAVLIYSYIFFKYDNSYSRTFQFIFFLLTIAAIIILLFNYLRQKEKLKNNDEITRQMKKTQAKNQRDLDMARLIQQSLLGDHCYINKEIKVIANCRPAEKIGGDFYTFSEHNVYKTMSHTKELKGVIQLQNQANRQFGICIGDVAGHGIASALIMLLAKSLLDQLLQQNTSPSKIFQLANKKLKSHTEKSDISFVTAALMLINLDNKTLNYSKAGHTDSILIKEDGTMSLLTGEGVFLGMFDNVEFEEIQIQLHAKDKIILYTDGIIETRSPSGEIFGVKRFLTYLESVHKQPLEKLIAGIHEELHNFSGKQEVADDATIVLVEIL